MMFKKINEIKYSWDEWKGRGLKIDENDKWKCWDESEV